MRRWLAFIITSDELRLLRKPQGEHDIYVLTLLGGKCFKSWLLLKVDSSS
jgi:hypothetical protein